MEGIPATNTDIRAREAAVARRAADAHSLSEEKEMTLAKDRMDAKGQLEAKTWPALIALLLERYRDGEEKPSVILKIKYGSGDKNAPAHLAVELNAAEEGARRVPAVDGGLAKNYQLGIWEEMLREILEGKFPTPTDGEALYELSYSEYGSSYDPDGRVYSLTLQPDAFTLQP